MEKAIARRGLLFLLCVQLGTGSSSATATEAGTDPATTQRNQATATPSCGTPSSHPINSTPLLLHHSIQPPTGSYDVRDHHGSQCLKAELGVQYVLTKKKKMLYINIDPSSVKGTGQCGQNTSNLTLNFPGGCLEFTFLQEEKMSYVAAVRTSLKTSLCKACKRELWEGVITNETLFKASPGLCYKCDTQTTLHLAETLSINIINAKIQAFGITDSKFGKEEECWRDFYRWSVPIILGGVAVGICLTGILSYLIVRENRRQGYEIM